MVAALPVDCSTPRRTPPFKRRKKSPFSYTTPPQPPVGRLTKSSPRTMRSRHHTVVSIPNKSVGESAQEMGKSLSISSSESILACEVHKGTESISKSTWTMHCVLAASVLTNALNTIIAKNPELFMTWCRSYVELCEHAEQKIEWESGCDACDVEGFLLGPERLSLSVGLLVLGRNSFYERCLNIMAKYMGEEFCGKFDEHVRRHCKVHKEMTGYL